LPAFNRACRLAYDEGAPQRTDALANARRFILLHDAEQIAIWIFQDYEIRVLSMSPGIPPRTDLDQSLYLTIPLVSIEV